MAVKIIDDMHGDGEGLTVTVSVMTIEKLKMEVKAMLIGIMVVAGKVGENGGCDDILLCTVKLIYECR